MLLKATKTKLHSDENDANEEKHQEASEDTDLIKCTEEADMGNKINP